MTAVHHNVHYGASSLSDAADSCCYAGAAAQPSPCPWHGQQHEFDEDFLLSDAWPEPAQKLCECGKPQDHPIHSSTGQTVLDDSGRSDAPTHERLHETRFSAIQDETGASGSTAE